MNRLLYPLVACALITILPFLLTFEKGQDIVRGLFAFEVFLVQLLYFLRVKGNRVVNALFHKFMYVTQRLV